jgi:hypothetical protein
VGVDCVCNLYSITTNQAAIIALFRVMNRYVGDLPPMPRVFPDYPAPVVLNAGTERANRSKAPSRDTIDDRGRVRIYFEVSSKVGGA